MKLEDFLSGIQSHDQLSCAGVVSADQPGDDFLLVTGRTTGARFKVLVTTILDQPWAVLEGILTGKRNAIVMDHVTRIVGYYSKVRNWNKSKVGELHDRQAGNYRVSGTDWDVDEEPLPAPVRATESAAACAAV
jgi:hypothetical protein